MADQFRHDALISLHNRRETAQLYMAIKDMIEGPQREPLAVLSALAAAFTVIAEQFDIDPIEGFAQIAEAVERGEFHLKDDPARGRYIHPMGHA